MPDPDPTTNSSSPSLLDLLLGSASQNAPIAPAASRSVPPDIQTLAPSADASDVRSSTNADAIRAQIAASGPQAPDTLARAASPDQFPQHHPILMGLLQAAASGNRVAGQPVPNLQQGSDHPVLSRVLSALGGLATAAGQVGQPTAVALQRQSLQQQMVEALARLQESAAWHQGMLANREQANDIRGQHYGNQDELGQQRLDQQTQQRLQKLQGDLAAKGLKIVMGADGTFNVAAIPKDQLSAGQQANIGLTNARTQDVATRGSRQLQIAANHDATRLSIAQLAHADRQVGLALLANKPEMSAAHDSFLLGMHDLELQRAEQDKNGYQDFGGSKSNFDTYYRGQQAKLADDLKSAASRAGVYVSPVATRGGNGPANQRIRVRDKATGQAGTILSKDFDASRYDRIQ